MSTEYASNDLTALYSIVKRLRGPEGCPWDQKQTPETITRYLLEESQELAEAMAGDDFNHVCEEIGDLFFIITMIVQIYEDDDRFTLHDTLQSIIEKMIRRHPHVFGGAATGSESELRQQWEAIKAREKKSG